VRKYSVVEKDSVIIEARITHSGAPP
jgi:hypothetical protein